MRRWLLDLGNTRLKLAPLQADGSVGEVLAAAHAGDPAAALRAHLPPRIDVAYVASVAAEPVRVALLDALSAHADRIGLARTQARAFGLQVAYAHPERLGVDRYLALLAASRAEENALVCGVGTALTLDLLTADGRHRGGCIAPSPTVMREALHARAAHLPVAGGQAVEFANDTADALASGCEGAALALIEDRLRRAAALFGAAPTLLLHGGGADVLRPQLPQAVHRPHLVLDGLAIWAAVEGSA